MMTDFEIRFDPARQGADMRPPGAKELVEALADFANDQCEDFTTRDAGDAHNYICALESRVQQLQYQLWLTIEQQKSNMKLLDAFQQLDRDTKLLNLTMPPLPDITEFDGRPGAL